MSEPLNLTEVLAKVQENIDGEKIEIREIVEALKHRGFGSLLLALALIALMPTGAIPGVPTITGCLIILIAGQLLFGKKSPWIPSFVADLSVDRDKFDDAKEKASPYTKTFDKCVKPRIDILTGTVAKRIVAAICIALGLLMPPLEVIPFAAAIPASAIVFLGLGLSGEDGLLISIGLTITAITFALSATWLL